MNPWRPLAGIVLAGVGALPAPAAAQQSAGTIRGVVYDQDFDAPLPGVTVAVVQGPTVQTTDRGNYSLTGLAPATYTLVFGKEGYVNQVRTDVIVTAGQLTDVDVYLAGEFISMEEFLVQDVLQFGSSTEAELLQLRFESPSMMDSISADLMSRAGASDAAGALPLIAGATVKDGKSAVIRGLPDRYVSSQLNRVRLPSADEDKRAVELDQYPSAVIETIQVSKTFTPDQQGDASGGAVDVRLKTFPDESVFEVKTQLGTNSEVTGRSDFLTYDGGGLTFWGRDDREIQPLGTAWDGAVGVSEGDAPIDSKWSLSGGGSHEVEDGVRVGGFASFFYERDSQLIRNGADDSWWVESPGAGMTPRTSQGAVGSGDFKTNLFDITEGSQSVQWGGLATVGIETENHAVGLTGLYTRTAEDRATLATDTRGKEYFFPGYDPGDPFGVGHDPGTLNEAPYLRTETLAYTERTSRTLQLTGEHRFEVDEGVEWGDFAVFGSPELDWSLSQSSATRYQPDKREFGALWLPASFNPGFPPYVPAFTTRNEWFPYKPGANFTLGNLQRVWLEIEEDSTQVSANLKMPFEQWAGEEGYMKVGVFDDRVDRSFDQDSFSNFNDNSSKTGKWSKPWSQSFPSESHHLINESLYDVDYEGQLDVSAAYAMMDLPLSPAIKLIGGARLESTDLSVVNDPEANAQWFPLGATAPVKLNPGDADVDFQQSDLLPAIGFVYTATDSLTVRTSYSQTIARQTFKEVTPIIQQEFLGGPIFIGNPELGMSSLENFDVRFDYVPYEGGLFSLSFFDKRIDDPIEYVQRLAGFEFTTAVNYPKGRLTGFEVEGRQDLGHFAESLEGLALGANATFIDSEVTLSEEDQAVFGGPAIQKPMSTRDMTNAPEHLYNLFLTYDWADTGWQLGLFYTITGDTLIAGAGESLGNFVPSVYALEYDSLNLSLSKRFNDHVNLRFQAKNLTDPAIEAVYRSEYLPGDVLNTSFNKGIELSLSLSMSF